MSKREIRRWAAIIDGEPAQWKRVGHHIETPAAPEKGGQGGKNHGHGIGRNLRKPIGPLKQAQERLLPGRKLYCGHPDRQTSVRLHTGIYSESVACGKQVHVPSCRWSPNQGTIIDDAAPVSRFRSRRGRRSDVQSSNRRRQTCKVRFAVLFTRRRQDQDSGNIL